MLRKLGHKLPAGPWHSPAADRNKDPILHALRRVLPPAGRVLELASGTGQHVVHFAAAFPGITWQPSDTDKEMHTSIRHRIRETQPANVLDVIDLDVMSTPWPVRDMDAIVCVNLIHVAPWPATTALFQGAREALKPGSPLVYYGPILRHDRPTANGNITFNQALLNEHPDWGLRSLDEVTAVADQFGFTLEDAIDMPANNTTLVFRKRTVA